MKKSLRFHGLKFLIKTDNGNRGIGVMTEILAKAMFEIVSSSRKAATRSALDRCVSLRPVGSKNRGPTRPVGD